MRLTAAITKPILHRAILALVLLAFLVPIPGRMPADEVRAAYAAQGLLCASESQDGSHHEAHCVLCLLPASGATPAVTSCPAPVVTVQIVNEPSRLDLIATAAIPKRQARAPPSSIV